MELSKQRKEADRERDIPAVCGDFAVVDGRARHRLGFPALNCSDTMKFRLAPELSVSMRCLQPNND